MHKCKDCKTEDAMDERKLCYVCWLKRAAAYLEKHNASQA